MQPSLAKYECLHALLWWNSGYFDWVSLKKVTISMDNGLSSINSDRLILYLAQTYSFAELPILLRLNLVQKLFHIDMQKLFWS